MVHVRCAAAWLRLLFPVALLATLIPTQAAASITISANLPAGYAGNAYAGTINASGGTANYTWTVNGNAVPTNGTPLALTDNLSVWSCTTAGDLCVGGTPSSGGSVPVSVGVKDSKSITGSGNYSITVNSTFQVSGQVNLNGCGSGVAGIKISINTTPVQSTTTNSQGQFFLENIPNGTYTVTPSITGASSVFYPASQSVTVSGSNPFASFWATLGYTVSGTVKYTGAKTGRIYITLTSNNCGNSMPGTSISAKGAFTIRGVAPGAYTAQAWMDNLGFGSTNASNPASSPTTVTVSSANLSNESISLADPSAVTLSTAPELNGVSAFNQGVVVPYNAIQNNNGVELASSYTLEWSTVSTFASVAGSKSFAASGANGSNVWFVNGQTVAGLAEGGKYYFRVRGVAGSSNSPWSKTVGPVTIGAPTGANTITGAVTFSPTATGPLYVGIYNGATNTVYADFIAHPVSPQSYSVKVPTGSNYILFGFVDQNNDGLVGPGDISNTNNNRTTLSISASATENFTLPSANSIASLTTQHFSQKNQFGTASGYDLNFDLSNGIKLPAAVTLISGPNVMVPMDVGLCGYCGGGFSFYVNLDSDTPHVGDAYGLQVVYSDGTSQTLTAKVSAVLNAFATGLAPTGTGDNAEPTFSWTVPANASAYLYELDLWDANGNQIWQVPGNNSNSGGFPSTITKLVWGVDPTNADNVPSVPSLTPGETYQWQIVTQDSNGNSANQQVSYQVSSSAMKLPAIDPASLGPAVVGQSYNGAITASGGAGAYSWTVTGLSDGLTYAPGGNVLAIRGTPTAAGTVTFTVSIKDANGDAAGPITYTIPVSPQPVVASCTPLNPSAATNAKLKGAYSVHTEQTTVSGGIGSFVLGAFTADGAGHLTGGIYDENSPWATSPTNGTFTGTYSIGTDDRGLITTKVTPSSGTPFSQTFCIALDSASNGVAGAGQMVEDDARGYVTHGRFYAQGGSAFTESSVKGSWAIGLQGGKVQYTSAGDFETRQAMAGYLTLDGAGNVTAAEGDVSGDVLTAGGQLQNQYESKVALTGTYTMASTGRGTMTVNAPGGASHFVFYLAGSNQILMLITDSGIETTNVGTNAILVGRGYLRTTSTFGLATLKGSSVIVSNGLTVSNGEFEGRKISAGILNWNGDGGVTGSSDKNSAGTVTLAASNTLTGSYAVDSVGRATITPTGNGSSLVFYLASPNQGFGLEADAGVDFFQMEDQTVPTGGFKAANYSGGYSFGSYWNSFLEQTAASGILNANSTTLEVAGTQDSDLDGTVAVDQAFSFNYAAATSGRFLKYNGSTLDSAIYLVSPTKAYAVDVSGKAWSTLIEFDHQ